MARAKATETVRSLAEAERRANTQAARLQAATENLKRLQEMIRPFTKSKTSDVPSTAGKWIDTASRLSRLSTCS